MRYLNVITTRNLVVSGGQHWEAICSLSQFAGRPVWDWVEEQYQDALDTLQEATGVILILNGHFTQQEDKC
jgi:hypothetical protein